MRHRFAGVRIANVFGATREGGSHSPLNRPNKLVNHPTHAWSDSGQVVSSSQKGKPSQSGSTCPYSSLEVIINDQRDPLGVRKIFVEAHCAPLLTIPTLAPRVGTRSALSSFLHVRATTQAWCEESCSGPPRAAKMAIAAARISARGQVWRPWTTVVPPLTTIRGGLPFIFSRSCLAGAVVKNKNPFRSVEFVKLWGQFHLSHYRERAPWAHGHPKRKHRPGAKVVRHLVNDSSGDTSRPEMVGHVLIQTGYASATTPCDHN